jgi:[ribosomal protein S5]-alanine N-acetyltransferase
MSYEIIAKTDVIRLEKLHADHASKFLFAVKRSEQLHKGYVDLPNTKEKFLEYVKFKDNERNVSLVVIDNDSSEFSGVININEIIKGCFNSAFLGYYAFEPFSRKGFMSCAMGLVMDYSRKELGLHRLEANIQPDNQASIRFIEKMGFVKEGFSKKYLKIGKEYKDHERFAALLF